jgi:hypothetical protein
MGTKTIKSLMHGTIDKVTNITNGEVCSDIRRSIAKEYLDSGANIHIHIGFNSEEYCAILDRNIEIGRLGDRIECARYADIFPQGAPAQNEVPVFIRVTEDLEIPEIAPIVICPRTVARLKRIDNGDYCVGHPFELTPLLSFIFGDIIEDRELVSLGRGIPFRQNKLPDEMVKRATEVVKHLSNKEFDTAWHGRYFLEAVDALSRCIIDIFGDNVRIDIAKGRQLSVQRLDVLLGPIKFSERTIH